MKNFEVSVQGKVYKTVSAKNVGEVLGVVAKDMKNGAVAHYDSSKSANVRIVSK
jgi:hypothetical protein